jgi:hypothetical protein
MDNTEAPKMSLRSLGSLFCETWSLYKERWSALVEIVLLPTLVVVLGIVLIGLNLGMLCTALGGLVVFIGWIIFVLSMLSIVYSIHNTAGVDASYRATIGWFWAFVWVVILELLAVFGGYAMLIIPGIWLEIALSFTAYVFVAEHRRGLDALRQSKDYVKGYWWAVLGRVLLLAVIYLAIEMIVRIPVALLAGQVAGAIVSALIALFFIPFAMLYQYVIFGNLRALKPSLADAHAEGGTGFIKASAIVGIAVPVLLVAIGIILVILGIIHGSGHVGYYAPPPGYGMQNY